VLLPASPSRLVWLCLSAVTDRHKLASSPFTSQAQEDWHKTSKEAKKAWEEAKNSDVGKELQKPEVWGSLLGIGEFLREKGPSATSSRWLPLPTK